MGSVVIDGQARITGLAYVSPSRLSTLQGCERRFHYQYVEGHREGGSEATSLGAAFAVGLETHNPERMIQEYRELRPEDPFTDPEDFKRLGEAHECMLRIAFGEYADRFGLAEVREVTYLTQIYSGEPDEYTVYENIFLQCRVDGLEDAEDALIEDKLRSGTAMRPEALQMEVRAGFQLSAEIWSHKMATGKHLPIHFRCLRKPNPRDLRTAIKAGTYKEFLEGHFQLEKTYQTFEVTRTESQLKDFERELRTLAGRAIAKTDRGGTPDPADSPRNTGHCFSYGRACPFIDRCTE